MLLVGLCRARLTLASDHFKSQVISTPLRIPLSSLLPASTTRVHDAPDPTRRPSIVCNAGFGGASQIRSGGGSEDSYEKPDLPESKDEAITQCAASIATQIIQPKTKSKGKGKAAATLGFSDLGKKLSVEVPVMDTSAAAAVGLATEIIEAMPTELQRTFTIVACSTSQSLAGGGSRIPVVDLRDCIDNKKTLGGSLIIASPSTQQLPAIEQLLASWSGPCAVLLNPEWARDIAEEEGGVQTPAQYVAFARSFDVAYCFFPIAIKAFVITSQEGVVFRRCSESGTGATTAPWRIYIQEKGNWVAVARMGKRPSSTDIEVSFYNANASTSPLTQGAKFIKGLMSKDK